jgi:hypothetical protein
LISATVTDDGIKILIESCTKLRQVHLSGYSRVTDESIKMLTQVTHRDCSIAYHPQKCPHIETLDLYDCASLTDVSLNYVGEYLTNLKLLKLSNDYEKYSEAGILALKSSNSILVTRNEYCLPFHTWNSLKYRITVCQIQYVHYCLQAFFRYEG